MLDRNGLFIVEAALPDAESYKIEIIASSTWVTSSGRHTAFVAGGWVQVLNNDVRVLADRAEHIAEIDTVRAETALKRAKERLAAPASAGHDVARAINAMHRAEARLAAARAKA